MFTRHCQKRYDRRGPAAGSPPITTILLLTDEIGILTIYIPLVSVEGACKVRVFNIQLRVR